MEAEDFDLGETDYRLDRFGMDLMMSGPMHIIDGEDDFGQLYDMREASVLVSGASVETILESSSGTVVWFTREGVPYAVLLPVPYPEAFAIMQAVMNFAHDVRQKDYTKDEVKHLRAQYDMMNEENQE